MNRKRGDILTIRDISVKVKIIDKYADDKPYELLYGVEFDEPIPDGHSCRGVGKDKHCKWMHAYEFEDF